MATEKRPNVKDVEDLQIFCLFDSTTGHYVKWFHYTEDHEAYHGSSYKDRRDMTLDEFATGLKRLSDDAIFPEVPTDQQITIAPKNLDGSTIHIKRPGLKYYLGAEKEAECATKDQVLAEVFTTESISKTPHPYLVRYHGCTVRRGRITGIAMERLGETLSHYARCPGGCISEHKTMFDQIDKQAFLAGVESAVKFLHSLGLAHNDINPRNIMKHDDFSLKRLAEWWNADSDSKDNWGNIASFPETPKAD